MSLDHYVTLGRSGLRVSPLCLGAMTFGKDWGWGADEETSRLLIDMYLERGGNFIDTANMYTKGHSEVILGEHLKNNRKRDSVVLATKFVGSLYTGDPNAGGAHRMSMMRNVEESLRRLQTDRIDLYWMHFQDPFTPIEETMRALDDLVRQGKVRYIGFSDTPAWECSRAQTIADFRGWSPVIALQIEYSLIERTPEADLIPMAQKMGMGVTPWSPLKGGILTGKYTRRSIPDEDERRYGEDSRHLNERTFTIVDELKKIAGELDRTPAEAALAWCRQRPGVESVIIGARTVDQMTSNLASADVVLSDEQMSRLNELSEPTLPFPHDFLKNAIPGAMQGGATINGRETEPWPLAPEGEKDRY